KYVEAVKEFATSPNAKTILFPIEATQLVGALGGIGDLISDAVGKPGGPPPPPAGPRVPRVVPTPPPPPPAQG
ncbi:MAG: SPFH/Band 7/PHB domain protein, partial [Novosphingobium sp.]|nr:SPFH/Band 7/PHB domain protein [Novosphingobium sp.]